ncbi:malonyl-CoA synthase [Lutimaribacter sp. EGI FJ00015]|uniref:Malonyl-CoA synthase n=1 Tax=Lutimaribacter degradans TaxID=2945989 RepID=A0ACC5ZY72_9RHOB|nr:malonyl-CoA synthase [Lutimaribacter sp. EGI FJ00013]MCM2562863.1 malonyl-CoA synthase [Lutimaribacter sp. EGI FJ00013]MCO0614020.1 malonyl-CoA synthase [Lutimaribacter sp. EGI FJ00015]MCO0636992.1 malonyl-CoA synthase [Lutimaribacter sp. EGI FJ00014]
MANPLYDTLFGQHAGRDTVFLHLPDGSTLTHDAFLRMTARFAHQIVRSGLQPGDRLAVQIAKSPRALAVYAACAQTGVIFLPLNTAYTPAEVAYFLENSGARLFLCDGNDAEALAPVSGKAGTRQETLNADGSGSFADLSAGHPESFDTVARDHDDLAAFLYTSGTTGRSKGAMLTQGNLLSNAQVLTDYWRFSADDVLLHALPIFHTHGLFVATNICLASGAQMMFYPAFDAETVVRDMPRATVMMGVPTFYTRLLDRDDFTAEVAGNMRLFISGSAPLLAETHREFEARTGHRILERYGMTETNMNTSNPYDGDRRAGTVGYPLPGVELRVCDEAGNELPQGEIGTIEVRGPNVFKGYWQMPEKTAEELRDNGFFITGDLGFVDADGYVTIVGRGKDLIISGGYNIYPKEIELVLDEAQGVLESAVIGVPHPDFGETPVGVLARRPGQEPDTDAIMASLHDALARFKHPRKLVVVDSLPRNTMGKVQKNVLRDAYQGLFTQG